MLFPRFGDSAYTKIDSRIPKIQITIISKTMKNDGLEVMVKPWSTVRLDILSWTFSRIKIDFKNVLLFINEAQNVVIWYKYP